VEYDSFVASCSSTRRARIRVAVCRCFLGASRSAISIASIAALYGSSRGEDRTGRFRGGGSADVNA
jgi:hypothetical protein